MRCSFVCAMVDEHRSCNTFYCTKSFEMRNFSAQKTKSVQEIYPFMLTQIKNFTVFVDI